jgi:hypothetical protein
LLESLSSLESWMQQGLALAALGAIIWSVRKSLAAGDAPRTGELAWSLVAAAVLAIVAASVRLGGGNGF